MRLLKPTVLAALLASGAAQALTLPPLPVARPDTYLLNSLTLEISAPGVLVNDSGTNLFVSNYVNPSEGTLDRVVTDGSFKYTPNRGFAGVATFDYIAVDAFGRSARATVSIDGSHSVPIANDDYYTASAATFTLGAPGLLANDTGGIGTVTLSNYTLAAAGTLETIVTDGSFRYQAAAGFTGTDTFTYFSVDELGRFSSATVSINVTAVPKPGTWLMLAAGLPLLAGAARRRRRA